MRPAYLNKKDFLSPYASRGAVMSKDGNDYELEIGKEQNASPEMMAFCQMIDEILDFLKSSNSPEAVLILDRYRQAIEELKKSA